MVKIGGPSFAEVNRAALDRGYLQQLYPKAKRVGRELQCGDIHGGPGRSFCVNYSTGAWTDNAADLKGGDIISLVAAREGLDQNDARLMLAKEFDLLDIQEPVPTKPKPLSALPPKPGKDLPSAPISGPPTHIWTYVDQDGQPLYEARRWEAEGYRKSCRSHGLTDDVERVPLGLPEVLRAIEDGRLITIAEGEGKVDALKAWGLPATTFINGAGGWRSYMTKWFAGATVVILPDADEPGRKFAAKVAADLVRVAERLKVVELPDPQFLGFDISDWIDAGGTLKQLNRIVEKTPLFEPEATKSARRPFQVDDPSVYNGSAYLERGPQSFNWLIKDSFRRKQLGIICGPPGSGKGLFSIHLAVALASGTSLFDFWEISEVGTTLLVSAEDDETILGNRLFYALQELPPEAREAAASRIFAVPVQGRVNICQADNAGTVTETDHFQDLKKLVAKVKPDLLVVDTLARVFGIDENSNPAMTAACGLVEEIIAAQGCNVLLIHHSNKHIGSDNAVTEAALAAALGQSAIRGASSLSGAIRWALMMSPLSDELALKLIGQDAAGKPSGQFVGCRVGKKNAGPPETAIYLEKRDHGLLARVLPESDPDQLAALKEKSVMEDAHKLTAEVDRRSMLGEKPLSVKKGAREAFGWGGSRAEKAAETAIMAGLLMAVPQGRGYVLALPSPVPINLGPDGPAGPDNRDQAAGPEINQ